MATYSTPYGFKPVRMIGNRVVGGALPTNQYRIFQNYTYPIPYGTPVVLSTTQTYTSSNACTVTYNSTTITLTFANQTTTTPASGNIGLFPGMAVTITGVTGTSGGYVVGGSAQGVLGTWILTGVGGTGSDSAGYTVYTITLPSNCPAITGTVGGTAVVKGGAGFVVPAATAFATGTAGNYIGIFQGCQYTNSANGQPQWDQWYPGGMDSAGMVAYVVDDPDAVFQVQASQTGFDALANVGYSFGYTTVTAGVGTLAPTITAYAGPSGTNYVSIRTKDSNAALDAGNATGTTLPYKVVDVSQAPDNINAQGFVDVYVTAQKATHLFTKAN